MDKYFCLVRATMGSPIQRISLDFGTGQTTINFGQTGYLSINDYLTLAREGRERSKPSWDPWAETG